jgi:hypothetical protein
VLYILEYENTLGLNNIFFGYLKFYFRSESSVADPDDFVADPDPTVENVRIRIRIGILALISFKHTIFY